MALDKDKSLTPMGYWGPFSMLQEMERMFDDLHTGFGGSPMRPATSRLPAVDIRDEGERYVVEAELPGIKKEEVSIEADADSLVIKAEREGRSEEKREGYVRKERDHMSFYRQVPLPEDVDHSQAEARLENGVLSVVLPKKADQSGNRRKLEIK